jgi:hypothetical protein
LKIREIVLYVALMVEFAFEGADLQERAVGKGSQEGLGVHSMCGEVRV